MGTPLTIRSTNELIYDYMLSSSYRSPWVYDPSFALKQDADVWEIVRNDAVVLSSLSRRNQSIVRPWRITPPQRSEDEQSKILAGICQEAFSNIERFSAVR